MILRVTLKGTERRREDFRRGNAFNRRNNKCQGPEVRD